MKRNREPLLVDSILRRLGPIGLGAPSVSLLQPIGKNELIIKAEHDLPNGMLEAIRKLVCRAAERGPSVKVTVAGEDGLDADSIVAVKGAYRLALVPARHGPAHLSTIGSALQGPNPDAAHIASRVFKSGKRPSIPFRVLRVSKGMAEAAGPYERLVTGIILEPEVVDGTVTPESEGDIYSEKEIFGAMSWWMENAMSAYAYHHTDSGGAPLGAEDVGLVENWQTRHDTRLGDQIARKGAWCQTNRIKQTSKGEVLWQGILSGQINSWSIETDAMGIIEEVNGPVEEAGEP